MKGKETQIKIDEFYVPAPKVSTLNTPDETFSEFLGKCSLAKAQKKMWVETTLANIISAVGDLEGKDYACFKDVKITTFGMSEKIEKEEAKSPHDRMHPESETVVVSGAV